jgi:surface polysaccharide O-acyltransferase-like enzyme
MEKPLVGDPTNSVITLDTARLQRAAVEVQPKTSTRLLFIDNIRVFLTILVILHHLMIIYSGTGDFTYTEGRQDVVSEALGGWFCATNQAYFMGLFLLISAYFVPGSYDRKGAGRFVKDRLIRLGIPLVLYSWVINPLFVYVFFYQDISMPFWRFFPKEYFKSNALIGAGPLWFVEVLLIFSFLDVLWRLLTRARSSEPAVETAFPGNGSIALFALLLGIAGFVARLVFVMDAYNFGPLNLQFAFFAQYIALFVVGLIAYRRNWLLGLPDKTGRLWLRIAILLVLSWAPMMVLNGAINDDNSFKGGWNWQALMYALWESFLCLSMCVGLIYAFRRYLNHRGKVAGFLVPNAYTAYIIHAPVIVILAYAVRDVTLYPLLKWVLVALLAVPLIFGLSSVVRKLPHTDRVL